MSYFQRSGFCNTRKRHKIFIVLGLRFLFCFYKFKGNMAFLNLCIVLDDRGNEAFMYVGY